MRDISLADEIYDDHKKILIYIQHLCQQHQISRSAVRALATIMGAHHLAEEEILYSVLNTTTAQARDQVGLAQGYHLVLDDLMYGIEQGDRLDETLRYQLLLLENLLRHHFLMEENELLPIFVDTFSRQQQCNFGYLYRQLYEQNIAILGPCNVFPLMIIE